jgi:hypothetical protein
VEKDSGSDLLLFTFDEQGYTEPGLVCLRLKGRSLWSAAFFRRFFFDGVREAKPKRRESAALQRDGAARQPIGTIAVAHPSPKHFCRFQ